LNLNVLKTIYAHHRHLLNAALQLKACFTCPWMVEGYVNLGYWDGLPAQMGHPFQY